MAEYYGIEKAKQDNLPKKKESLLDKLKRCESVGVMRLKGYTLHEIAEDQGISPATAKAYADEYFLLVRETAEGDPDFMDRVQENTIRFLKEFEEIGKESWETVRIATDAGMVGARINALKLASEIAGQKARLLQLLGAKVDSSYVARMQRAEAVNQLLSSVIRDIVSECSHCRDEAQVRLAEAFSMMNDNESTLRAREYEEEAEDAELVEEDEEG